ncbi:MAG: DUF1428 domain-containing protein [Candidatus Pacebacteria bacterium]|nr:DUF1428 domain-containing protein [Candidatus Paceibacterota bacterium]
MAIKKQGAKYVDGFVLVVPKNNVAAYKKMAKEAKEVWVKFGALDYKECMGEDLSPKQPEGSPTLPLSFASIVKAGPEDTVWFSYITFKNKTHRTQVNKKVMAYFDKKYKGKEDMPMPFDMQRMAYAGFSVQVG